MKFNEDPFCIMNYIEKPNLFKNSTNELKVSPAEYADLRQYPTTSVTVEKNPYKRQELFIYKFN